MRIYWPPDTIGISPPDQMAGGEGKAAGYLSITNEDEPILRPRPPPLCARAGVGVVIGRVVVPSVPVGGGAVLAVPAVHPALRHVAGPGEGGGGVGTHIWTSESQ